MAIERQSYLTRRSFLLAGGAGLLAAVPLARAGIRAARHPDEIFLSASDGADGRHFVTACDLRGRELFSVEVDTRCHGVALHPSHPGRAIVVARRPGTIAYDVDVHAGVIQRRLESARDRHFYGHAAFSRDGRVLFTSENDIPRSQGVVAVRDAEDLRVLAEIPTYGIGPHELLALPDGDTLAIANGGLVTDLADGKQRRRDLNIPDMDPSLVFVDVRSGRLLEQARPDDHFASVRHLALARDGTVAVAMQYEGPETNPYPVLGFHRGGSAIETVSAPHELRVRMQRYAASVCVSSTGVAAVTCPRGDTVAFFSTNGDLVASHEVRDAGGVATIAGGSRFLVTTGLGEMREFDARTGLQVADPERIAEIRWDNHAVATLRG
ncbi:DUF1513 domain-containing protein [Candidatus Binatia bacterium]|nr:DUF1513 domain-containing protein [Candidatus Binatia bacterium]